MGGRDHSWPCDKCGLNIGGFDGPDKCDCGLDADYWRQGYDDGWSESTKGGIYLGQAERDIALAQLTEARRLLEELVAANDPRTDPDRMAKRLKVTERRIAALDAARQFLSKEGGA